jgi:hypothetical protein
MYKFWGWLNYFLMDIRFIVTAVNITRTLDNDDGGGVVYHAIYSGRMYVIICGSLYRLQKTLREDWGLRIAPP